MTGVFSDYDWKSGKYSTWTESRWDLFKVRVFLIPSKRAEVRTHFFVYCMVTRHCIAFILSPLCLSLTLSVCPSLSLSLSLSLSCSLLFVIYGLNPFAFFGLFSLLCVFDIQLMFDLCVNWFGGGNELYLLDGGGWRYYLVAVKQASIFWSCVKVEVAVLGFPSLILVPTVSVDVKQQGTLTELDGAV